MHSKQLIHTNPNENTQVRLAELEIYQARMAAAFNKRVKFRSFGVGDLVLTIRRPIAINRKTQAKFESK